MKTKLFLYIIIFFLSVGVDFGTTPARIYYKYFVTGSVLCDSLFSKSGFTIQLFGKSLIDFPSDYTQLSYSNIDFERPIFITDSTGNFSLIVNSYVFYDSVKTAIIIPGGSHFFSPPYFIDKSSGTPVEIKYTEFSQSSGCGSCTDEPQSTRISRFEHFINLNINYCK